MRLSAEQIAAIKEIGWQTFGHGAEIYLFGSRTDDARRGGDIDLLVDLQGAEPEEEKIYEKKLQFQTRLQMRLGDQRIDVILSRSPQDDHRPIVKQAFKNKQKL